VVSAVAFSTAIAAGLVVFRVVTEGAYDHRLGAWGAPLGIVWRVDGLACVMILLNTLVGCAVGFYGLSYFGKHEGKEEEHGDEAKHFWPLWI